MTNNKQNPPLWEEFEWDDAKDSISISDFFLIIKRLLPWIVICAILGGGLSWVYYKKQEPQYKVKAKILIKDEASAGMKNMDAFQSLGLMSGASSVDNELEIITTHTILEKVVEDLALNVLVKKDQFFNAIGYNAYNVPFDVEVLQYKASIFESSNAFVYPIVYDGNTFFIEINDEQVAFSLNKALVLPLGTVVIRKKKKEDLAAGSWVLSITNPSLVADRYVQLIKPSIASKNTSVISLEINTPNPDLDKVVINTLIDTYIREGVKDNNSINDSTLVFINERLAQVSDELGEVEGNIQNFKQQNNISDISQQTSMLLESTKENSQKLFDTEVQLNVISSLESYLRNSKEATVIPSNLLVPDGALSILINQYNNLLLQRDRMAKTATEENPTMININGQLDAVRSEIMAGIASLKRTNSNIVGQLRKEANKNIGIIKSVPKKEREFLDISRQQQIKQELYLFLLKKREETAVGKSSTLSNTRVIDYARVDRMPFSPKRNMILLVGLIFGSILPIVFHYARRQLNFKIQTKSDIKESTQMPILGEIGHQNNAQLFEVKSNPRSPLAEQFRILRTNLYFYKKQTEATIVMITSSIPGEGKTFVSLNLAATLAANKEAKVLVIGMDLRKPRLAVELRLKNDLGFSEFIVNQATLDQIIYPLDGFDNLFVIPSGSIPPDPSELLMSSRTQKMFEDIKKDYDFIVVDCPPSLVTDYQIISKHTDLCLYVSRIGYTEKRQLEMANELYRLGKITKMNLVVNDFDPNKYDGYNGSYYNQYGYYENVEKQSFWKKWLKS